MGQGFCGSPVPTVPLPLLVHAEPMSLTPEGRCQRPLIVRLHFGPALLFICPIVFIYRLSNPIPFQRNSAVRDTQSRMTAHCFPF
jgi:hypothetical protein